MSAATAGFQEVATGLRLRFYTVGEDERVVLLLHDVGECSPVLCGLAVRLASHGYKVRMRSFSPTLHVKLTSPHLTSPFERGSAWLCAHQVIMLDLRGHGDSAPSAEGQYSAASMAADVESFVTERDLYTRPLAVVGVGLGAAVGLAFASAQPQLVRHLITSPHTPQRAHATARSVLSVSVGVRSTEALSSLDTHTCVYAATPSLHFHAAGHCPSEHEVGICSE